MTSNNDDDRRNVPLVAQPLSTILPVVGNEWCFSQSVTLRSSCNEWMSALTLKNETTKDRFAKIKYSLSATQYINPQVEPFAVFDVIDGQTKNQVLTVRRGSHSSKYEVHSGLLHRDAGPQPCLFSTMVNSENANPDVPMNETVYFRDMVSGEAYEASFDGHFKDDRVTIVRIRKDENGEWQPVARIVRPIPKFYQAEYYTIEVAAGMDAMFISMLWLGRWGENQRETPNIKSYTVWGACAPMDLTKKEKPPPPNPDF